MSVRVGERERKKAQGYRRQKETVSSELCRGYLHSDTGKVKHMHRAMRVHTTTILHYEY